MANALGQVFAPADVDGLAFDDSRTVWLRAALAWMRDYLSAPDERIGRTSPVCPFVPETLEQGRLWFAVSDAIEPDRVAAVMAEAADEFERRIEGLGKDAQFAALAVVFRAVTSEAAASSIDAVQHRLKVPFVGRGLMIGEFHPANRTPAASPGADPDAFPNRAPVPMLAVRVQVPNDKKFLTGAGYDVLDQARLKRGYLVGKRRWAVRDSERDMLDEAIAGLGDLIDYVEAKERDAGEA